MSATQPATGLTLDADQQASIGSTLGSNESVANIICKLKKDLMGSPRSYQGRPCTVIAVVGFKGSGKSTFINTLVSLLCGSPVSVQRCNAGSEATASTTTNLLIPVHQFLFPSTSPPPFYFFIWDTVGIDYGDTAAKKYEHDAVRSQLRQLLNGKLPSYGTASMQCPNESDKPLPAQMVFVLAHSAKQVKQLLLSYQGNENEASFIKNAQAVCANYGASDKIPDHFKGLPLYVVATCFDELYAPGKGPYNPATGADSWEKMQKEPSVVAAVKSLSGHCNVPYSRTHISFGLDTLRPNPLLRDVRQLAVLSPVANAVQEVVARDIYLLESRKLLLTRENLTVPYGADAKCSLPYMSVKDLAGYFTATAGLESGAPIITAQEIDGAILIRQPPATIRRLFQHFGLCERIIELVAPYQSS